ncbi:hypothetical protein FQN57_000925 [Myotisia sp. PD_48]|nr:hypothetical protein FQN57_000925 [Myotisia sp. PD_48]
MQQCGVNPGSYSTMTLIKEWLWNWSVLLLIGVIMVPLCKQLHELAGRIMAKLVAVLHLGVMCLLALLLMVYLGLASAIPNMDSTSRRTRQNLNRVAIWAYVAYNAVAVIGTGAAGASILIALIRSAFIRRSPSKKWIIILIPSSVLMMLTELAFQINFAIRRQSYTPPAWAAYIFLSNIFIILAMMAVVSLATDPSTVGPATTNQQNHPTSTSYSYTPVAGQGFNPYDGVKTEYSSASQPAAQPYQPVPGNTNHHPGAEVRNPLLQRPGNEPTPAPAYSHQNPNYYQ